MESTQPFAPRLRTRAILWLRCAILSLTLYACSGTEKGLDIPAFRDYILTIYPLRSKLYLGDSTFLTISLRHTDKSYLPPGLKGTIFLTTSTTDIELRSNAIPVDVKGNVPITEVEGTTYFTGKRYGSAQIQAFFEEAASLPVTITIGRPSWAVEPGTIFLVIDGEPQFIPPDLMDYILVIYTEFRTIQVGETIPVTIRLYRRDRGVLPWDLKQTILLTTSSNCGELSSTAIPVDMTGKMQSGIEFRVFFRAIREGEAEIGASFPEATVFPVKIRIVKKDPRNPFPWMIP